MAVVGDGVHPLDLALRAAGVLGSFAGVGKGFPGRAMPHTYAAYATRAVAKLRYRPDARRGGCRRRSDHPRAVYPGRQAGDKPENGWVAEGRALLARAHLKSVAWPFWTSFGTLGAGMFETAGRSSGAMWRDGWG